MKYIFDFDDVLFNNTAQFKEHMYACLVKAGIPRDVLEGHYFKVREKKFSLHAFIKSMFALYGINMEVDVVYHKIMNECSKFLNTELIEAVKRIGKENCYIVTQGDLEFQQDKIRYSGIEDLFEGIVSVADNKRKAIAEICALPGNEGTEFVFLDDREEHIKAVNDLPNVTTLHYKKEDFDRLMRKNRDDGPVSELKKRR